MIHVKRQDVKRGKLTAWIKMGVLLIGVYLFVVFCRGIWEIRLAYLRLSEANALLMAEEQKSRELGQKQAEVTGLGYIEQVARNNLNMQKDGEIVVVFPMNLLTGAKRQEIETAEVSEPNWQKWWGVVSGKMY